MTEPISLEDLQQLIAGYVLYDLSPEESAILERLLADNPAIAQEIEQMQQAVELAYAPAEIAPPESLRTSVLQSFQTSMATANVVSLPTHRSRWRRWSVGLGATAAVMIVGLGINNYVLWRSLQTLQAQQQATELMTVSLQPISGVDRSASLTVTIDATNLAATLNAENLPPLSEGEVYALWTVLQADAPFTVDDKNAILTATLTSEAVAGDPIKITLPRAYREQDVVTAIAITIEAADAPQRHEAAPILFTNL
ncbi:MAG: anti-sigma factor domain-containing protein [Leptolyngbyaceae cyanobacterium]